jgi:curved DNA-binding protein CbpA
MRDFYEILQVHRRAEPEVIRAAYRILAHKYHPDHGGDAARMVDLNDAFDVLGDPVRRAAYDASLASGGSSYPASTYSGPSYASSVSGQPAADIAHAGPPPGRPSGSVLDFGRSAPRSAEASAPRSTPSCVSGSGPPIRRRRSGGTARAEPRRRPPERGAARRGDRGLPLCYRPIASTVGTLPPLVAVLRVVDLLLERAVRLPSVSGRE